MPIQVLKPTSPGRRGYEALLNDDLTVSKPLKALIKKLKKHSGRNNMGRITTRHQGGGARKQYRMIDFRRNKPGIPATVATIEYDPNRNVRICLLNYHDGEKRYILAPQGLTVGDIVSSGDKADIKVGNALLLKNIPLGTMVHNIELTAGKGGQLVRSAGGSAQIVAKEGHTVTLRLPSGEMRMVHQLCMATVGVLGNADFQNASSGKAGRTRWLGVRPTVRGSAMNPVDHPHGGGEGKAPIGRSGPVSPWGKKALGAKTRVTKKYSDRWIVSRRQNKR